MAPKHVKLQTFISHKTFTVQKETKTCQEQPNLVSVCLIQFFYKMTTFEWSQEWSSYTGLTVYQLLLKVAKSVRLTTHFSNYK